MILLQVIGTSGVEIGGAFGGEKYTGGGKESGKHMLEATIRKIEAQ
jgi:aldehyde dehydrogenase (NAD+)